MTQTHDNVIVLYGALRSGTTMVRLMLDQHPAINCPGERDFIVGHLEDGPAGLTLDKQGLEDDRIFRASGMDIPQTDDAQAAFWDMVHQHKAQEQTLILVLHRHVKELLQVFPDAKIIHLIRDPRDVARSSIGMGWAGNTYYGVDHWLGTERDWDAHTVDFSPDQICQVQFEELLTDPQEHLTRLCAFMGLAYDPEMLNFDENSTYSKVDPSLAYQWKRKQTGQELGELEYKIGDLLAARGYAPSGNPVAAPTGLRGLSLNLQNKRHKFAERVRRFGLKDTLLLTLFSRLGLTDMERKVLRRRDEKVRAYLK